MYGHRDDVLQIETCRFEYTCKALQNGLLPQPVIFVPAVLACNVQGTIDDAGPATAIQDADGADK
jgi:hypothetical protein